VIGVPVHVPSVGVTVITPVIGEAPGLVAVKAGTVVLPLAPSPMAVFELVHVKLAPAGLLVNVFAGTVAPAKTGIFASGLTVGTGFTVTVPTAVPVHPADVTVTV
jgi:hypothetical protein